MTCMDAAFVSTGSLPAAGEVARLVDEAYRRFLPVDEGAVSEVYPGLRVADPARFGVVVAGVTGATNSAGDSAVPFSIMSGAKPFVFALACAALGTEQVRARVGANATALPFNALSAVERSEDGRTNPMVNPGAIATTALMANGEPVAEAWERILVGLSAFAGRPLTVDEDVYRSAAATNHRNRALAQFLYAPGALATYPDEAVELYTRQSCVAVTAEDLAVMGATLADGGVHPRTGERVVDLPTCRATLTTMITAGMYETSGDWLYDVGLPGKSGIGGVVTVSPGKGALGTFSPPLDAAGNSVRGTLCASFLSRTLGLDILAPAPAPTL